MPANIRGSRSVIHVYNKHIIAHLKNILLKQDCWQKFICTLETLLAFLSKYRNQYINRNECGEKLVSALSNGCLTFARYMYTHLLVWAK